MTFKNSLSALSALIFLGATSALAADDAPRRFDFGPSNSGALAKTYKSVGANSRFSAATNYGWLDVVNLQERDRKKPDVTRRDLVFGEQPHTFRIGGLKPGLYRLTVVCGDADYGNHATRVTVGGETWPTLKPRAREFQTVTGTVRVTGETLDIKFDLPPNSGQNWAVNSIALEAATAPMKPQISSEQVTAKIVSRWNSALFTGADPTQPLLADFRAKTNAGAFAPTGLTRADYLKLIVSQVDYWKTQQNADGAIIDPYLKYEWQYSTPSYALAGAAAVAWGGRTDLLESSAKAMDWSVLTLSERRAATNHEDFFAPLIAHAYPLLKPLVAPERAARWEAQIRGIDPYKIYRQPIGANNWNLVAASGEAGFQRLGLRPVTNDYVNDSIAAQGIHFRTPYGLYLEGPMAYDAFPRLWLSDVVAHGYEGNSAAEMTEALRRGSVTSLFLQSPWGELPAGHRSANHQWNEAEQCVIYEVYGAQALKNGDAKLAGIYKRAAHLSLASMQRWVRPSGEMQIIKHWFDPAKLFAYEGYSGHSNYNLLPTAMLVLAYENAQTTTDVAEAPAPADVGGFVVNIEPLHKIIANVAGTYVELDTKADHRYDATGLIRVHVAGLTPQLGPSDSLVAEPKYKIPAANRIPAAMAVGIAWKDAAGAWHRLGELTGGNIVSWSLDNVKEAPDRVSFDVNYRGDLFGVTRITESYVVTQGRVELTTKLDGYNGPLRYQWPLLADDGRTQSTIKVEKNSVSVTQDGGKTAQTFSAQGATSVSVGDELYGNHNGLSRIATAEFPNGGAPTLVIAPQR